MIRTLSAVVLASSLLLGVGCGSSETASEPNPTPAGDHSYLMSSEPDSAMPVGEARERTLDGQQITLVGVIGGSSEPFVDGLAAFTIVDPKVSYCAAEEGCPTPWDYCCTQDQVADNIATVKMVDASGAPVPQSAKELLGVKELSRVVVSGTAQRDPQGNLTVAADKVYVRD